ncbi:hypothetical protein ACFC6L_30000 [Kitasatospora phosalacinea]|uniref:hypothetical protein n=1 Tax=Kitasatospora phosalacinea TaxID=2065 RepID=UPI0035D8FF74
MSTGFDVMELATRASDVLVVEAARSGWSALRERIAGFLARGGQDFVDGQLADLDAAHEALAAGAEGARDGLRSQWLWQVGAYLQRHPDAAGELEQLLSALDDGSGPAGTVMNANGNTGSVVIQSGGSVTTGTGGITTSALPRS